MKVDDLEAIKMAFEANGFVVVDDVFSEAELSEMEAFFESYKNNGGQVFDKGSRYEEIDPKERQVRAMHPHRYSQRVVDWLLHPRVAQVLETLMGCAPLGVQTMYYYKPPGAKGQGMHQDNFYLQAKPHTCMAAWTPIDDSEIENGCLYMVPGSQNYDVHCPEADAARWRDYTDSHITGFPEIGEPVPVPVRRGQTLFFGGQVIHGSGPNTSAHRSRRTFIGHYVDAMSESVSKFYHPVLTMQGEVVSNIEAYAGGGPCGDVLAEAVH